MSGMSRRRCRDQIPARLDRLPGPVSWRVVIGLGGVWVLDASSDDGRQRRVAADRAGQRIELTAARSASPPRSMSRARAGRCSRSADRQAGPQEAVHPHAVIYWRPPWHRFAHRGTSSSRGSSPAPVSAATPPSTRPSTLIPARGAAVDLASRSFGSARLRRGARWCCDTALFAADIDGGRVRIGALFGLIVLLVRRMARESALAFIHGRQDEPTIVTEVRHRGRDGSRPAGHPDIRQRDVTEIARWRSPVIRRAILGLHSSSDSLPLQRRDVTSARCWWFSIDPVASLSSTLSGAASRPIGSAIFDTVGRKRDLAVVPRSAAVAVILAFVSQSIWMFMSVLGVCFFLASAGASAAYLTVSEIFPMETRALAIAFFYAWYCDRRHHRPLLFGKLIESGVREQVMLSF